MSNQRSNAHRKTDPARARERERRVVELWLSGASSDQIAQQLGVTPRSVRRIRERLMAARADEFDPKLIEQLRQLEIARLDRLQLSMRRQATRAGDTRAAGVVIKCIDRRVKLLGLDAPHKIDARVNGELDAQIEALVAELEAVGLVTTSDTPQ